MQNQRMIGIVTQPTNIHNNKIQELGTWIKTKQENHTILTSNMTFLTSLASFGEIQKVAYIIT